MDTRKQSFNTIRLLIRIALISSICSLVLSSFLVLACEPFSRATLGMSWYSIMGSGLIVYATVFTLIIIAIWARVRKERIWPIIKKESLLLLGVFAGLALLGFINYMNYE